MSLRESTDLKKYVSELNGYLKAISHLNDEVGFRHGFFSDLIDIKNNDFKETIKSYVNENSVKLIEINSGDELNIIKHFTFNNFLHNKCTLESKSLSFIKEQINWHIQDYFTIAGEYSPELGKYKYQSKKTHNSDTMFIFTIYKKQIAIMHFHFRRENST